MLITFIQNYLKENNLEDYSKFTLQDDGAGVYIRDWDYEIPMPELPSANDLALDNAKSLKLVELDSYYFNSTEIREMKLNDYFVLSLSFDGRNLILEQIQNLEQQIILGSVTEENAKFEYFYNVTSIEVTLGQLRQIYIFMLNTMNTNYGVYKSHINTLKNLTTINEIENYDFKTNYLKNQNLLI